MSLMIMDLDHFRLQGLRRCLNAWFQTPVIAVHSPEEAIKTIGSIQKPIEAFLINSNSKFLSTTLDPPLLKVIQKIDQSIPFTAAPLLLLVPDQLTALILQKKYNLSRVDYLFIQPVSPSGLISALKKAQKNRLKSRKRMLFFGNQIPESLHVLHQEELLWVADPCSQISPKLMACCWTWIIDVRSLNLEQQVFLKKKITAFKKTPLGALTPMVCLNQNPDLILTLRSCCQKYWPDTPTDWPHRWKELRKEQISRFQRQWLFRLIKTALQKENWKEAKKNLKKLMKLSPITSEVSLLAGDFWFHQKQSLKAKQYYEQSIQLHPSHPRPYLQLFRLAHKNNWKLPKNFFQQARQYCPHEPGISKILQSLGT